MNLYEYAGSNPTSFVDPWGESWWTEFKGGMSNIADHPSMILDIPVEFLRGAKEGATNLGILPGAEQAIYGTRLNSPEMQVELLTVYYLGNDAVDTAEIVVEGTRAALTTEEGARGFEEGRLETVEQYARRLQGLHKTFEPNDTEPLSYAEALGFAVLDTTRHCCGPPGTLRWT